MNENTRWDDFHAPNRAAAIRTANAMFGWTLLNFALLTAVVYPILMLILQWVIGDGGWLGKAGGNPLPCL